jgi:hypothetical protein
MSARPEMSSGEEEGINDVEQPQPVYATLAKQPVSKTTDLLSAASAMKTSTRTLGAYLPLLISPRDAAPYIE